MHQAHLQLGPTGGKTLRHRRRGPQIGPLRFFDDGQDDVRLPSLPTFATDELEYPLALAAAPNRGAHRAPPRGALPERGNVEIAVQRQGQRPRNRRGCQEQYVGSRPFPDQGGPLLDPETMLLVDHHQSEPLKRDALLKQRVGTDNDSRLAGGNPLSHRGLLGRGLPPEEQLRLEIERSQQRFQRGPVLLGQQLGGRHERRLEVVLHRQQHGE